MEKHGRAIQITDGNILLRMRFSCWITKASDTHSDYPILTAFPRQQSFLKRRQCYVYTYVACLIFHTYVLQADCSKHIPEPSLPDTQNTNTNVACLMFHTYVLQADCSKHIPEPSLPDTQNTNTNVACLIFHTYVLQADCSKHIPEPSLPDTQNTNTKYLVPLQQ